MKTKDIIFYSSVAAIGILAMYVMFFTNVFITWSEPEKSTETSSVSNLSKLNTGVTKENVGDFDEKVDLYDEELKEQQEEEERLEQEEAKRKAATEKGNIKVNDLSKFLKKEESLKEDKPLSSPVVISSSPKQKEDQPKPKPVQKRATQVVEKQPDPLPTQTAERKRRRRDDPTFGDEAGVAEEPVKADDRTTPGEKKLLSAKIHGKQVVTEGSRVVVRLTEPYYGKCKLEVNTILTGIVSINGQRINIVFTACSKEGTPEKLYAFDYSDGEKGIYVENLTVNQELGKDAAQETAGEVAQELGIPVVGNVLRSGSNKKISSPSITFDSGRPIYVKSIPSKL